MLVKIEVYNDGDLWCARGIGEDIFTQGQTVDELYRNIQEAVALHFEDKLPPSEIDVLIVSQLKLAHARLPQVSGRALVKLRVSLWNNIPKETLIERLR